jgi:hypothetical protein
VTAMLFFRALLTLLSNIPRSSLPKLLLPASTARMVTISPSEFRTRFSRTEPDFGFPGRKVLMTTFITLLYQFQDAFSRTLISAPA